MLKLPPALIASSTWLHTSNDAIICYLTMRLEAQLGQTRDAKYAKSLSQLVSSTSRADLAEKLGLPEPTVARVQTELVRRQWMTTHEHGYQLGEIKDQQLIWYAEQTPEAKVAEPKVPVLEQIEADTEHLTGKDSTQGKSRVNLAERLASLALSDFKPKETRPKDIRLLFLSLYKEKYGEDAPLISERAANPYAMTHSYIARAVKWANNSGDKTAAAVTFLFEHWDEIREIMRLDGRESFHLMGSSKIWPRILVYVQEGMPAPQQRSDAVTNRAETSDPVSSVGW